MVEIIPMDEINPIKIVKRINSGEIFIYPTDTIYGLGCDATNEGAVKSIRVIKQRYDKPFSIIAPNKPWILKNFEVAQTYIEKLPGPFTYLLKAKQPNLVAPSVTSNEKIGVRMPNHQFTSVIQRTRKPFVTTSVNLTGGQHYTDLKIIPREIIESVDIVIDAGKLENRPSAVIDLTEELPKILRL